MKKAIELFPDFFLCEGNYEIILKEFGKILIQVDDDDYQGDSRVLLYNDGKYGILIFGFGSCSGCDALQSCQNTDEIDELMQNMYNDIHWFDDLESCKKWVRERDWELQHSWHCDETKDFIQQVLNY